MPYYKFTFKKGLIILELESEDSRFMKNQIDKCLEEVTGLDLSGKPAKSKPSTKTESKKPEKVTTKKVEPPVEEVSVVEEISAPVETVVEDPKTEAVVEETVIEPAPEVIVEELPEIPQQPETVIEITEKASKEVVIETDNISSLTEVDEIVLTIKEDAPVESVIDNIKAAAKDVIEIEAQVVEEPQEVVAEYKFAEFTEKSKNESVEVIEPVIEESVATEPPEDQQNNKFYQLLQEKFSSLPEMVNSNLGKKLAKPITADNKYVDTLEELVANKQPKELIEYLVITAFYLKEKEMLDRYSLKQINAKVMAFTKKPVDHSIIQEAVAKGLIEVVPDYTGLADVTEYTITPEGEKFVNEL